MLSSSGLIIPGQSTCSMPNALAVNPPWARASAASRAASAMSCGISACVGAWVSESKMRGERSEEHTSELQSLAYLVCRLLLEKKKKKIDAGSLQIQTAANFRTVAAPDLL